MNHRFLGFSLAAVAASVLSASGTLNDGLVLYYNFDTNTGSGVYDQSGNGHNAMVYGAAYTAGGKTGGAYHYDGTNDYVLIGNLGYQSQGTISFWMYADAVENVRNPFTTDYASWDDCIRFEEGAPGDFVVGLGPILGGKAYTTNFQAGAWTHVIFAWTTNGYWGWLNGEQKFSAVHNNELYLGFPNVAIGNGYSTSPNRYWKGKVDEVLIYNRVLSTSEVSSLYSGLAPDPAPEPDPDPEPDPNGDLVLYYSFDTNTGATVYDQSGNGHTGLVNGPAYTATGRVGGAYQYDGINDHILAGNLGYLDQGTIAFWMYADAIENWRNPFTTDYASWDDCIRFEEGAPGDFVVGLGPILGGAFYTSAMQPKTWYHVAFAWTGNEYCGWLNGQLAFSATHNNQLYLNFNNVAMGNGYSTDPGRYWKGMVDEVRIYNRVLLSGEIATLAGTGEVNTAGWLTVNIEPEGARIAEAQWRLASDAVASWHDSGFSRCLEAGDYTVVFKPLGGWVTPSNGNVTIGAGSNSFLVSHYEESATNDTVPPTIVSIDPPDGYACLGNDVPMTVVVTDNVAVASVRFNHSNAVDFEPPNTYLYTRNGVRGSFNPVTIVARDTYDNATTQSLNYVQSRDLLLTAMWDGYWRVRNPFTNSIDCTWNVVGGVESGSVTAVSNRDSFFTNSLGLKTVRLYTNGVLVDTKESSRVNPSQGEMLPPAEIDSDEDGMNNREEELAGTDPNSKESIFYLQIDPQPSESGGMMMRPGSASRGPEPEFSYRVFSWPSGMDSAYTLETSTNISTWKTVTGAINTPGTGGIMSYTNRTDDPLFYLRIRAQKLE